MKMLLINDVQLFVTVSFLFTFVSTDNPHILRSLHRNDRRIFALI